MFVNSQVSVASFHLSATFVELPLSISILASTEGTPVTFEFKVIELSSTKRLEVFKVVVSPETVKLPGTLRFPLASKTAAVPPVEVVMLPDRLISPPVPMDATT